MAQDLELTAPAPAPTPKWCPLTVADEVFYDSLPQEIRDVCDKIIAARVAQECERPDWDFMDDEVYREGYSRGVADGIARAVAAGKDAGAAPASFAPATVEASAYGAGTSAGESS